MTAERIAESLALARVVMREVPSPSIVPDLAEDVFELVAEVERLRVDYAILSDDYRAVQGRALEAYNAGQAAERRAVMAWLHRLVAPGVPVGELEALADAIEGGDHHR